MASYQCKTENSYTGQAFLEYMRILDKFYPCGVFVEEIPFIYLSNTAVTRSRGHSLIHYTYIRYLHFICTIGVLEKVSNDCFIYSM